MAGSAVSRGAKAAPISRCCCNGMHRRSTPRPSPILRSSSQARASERFATNYAGLAFRNDLGGQPALQKNAEPGAPRIVVHRAIVEMRVARPRPGQLHAVMPAHHPAMNHGVGHFGMKLQREGAAVTNRLHFEYVARG